MPLARRFLGLCFRLRWHVARLRKPPPGFVTTWWGTLAVDPRDSVSAYLNQSGVYDEPLSLEIAQRVRPGTTVLNIGANIGYLAVIAAERASRVYAFEPDPRSFALLVRNQGDKIVPINAAVGEHDGTCELWLDERSFGNTSIARENTDEAKPISVRVVSVDSFLESERMKADLIVMDVQGSEVSVLRGMQTTLTTLPIILFELWPYGLANCGASADELRDTLLAAGYRLEHVERGLPDPQRDWPALLRALRTSKNGRGFCNLLAVPGKSLCSRDDGGHAPSPADQLLNPLR